MQRNAEDWDLDGDGVADGPMSWFEHFSRSGETWECCGFAAARGRR